MDILFACEPDFLDSYINNVVFHDYTLDLSKNDPSSFIFLAPDDNNDPTDILSIDGDTAKIDIQGPLSKREPSAFMRSRYGGTSYPSIINAIDRISESDEIKTVRLVMDTPGGVVTGLDEVWIALRELAKSKRVIAENHGMIASAGYWIASAASEIIATSPSVETGSIGVQMVQTDWTEYDKKNGIKEVRIISKNAPNKNPDVTTQKGIERIQERLDALERVFISRVAEGRGVTDKKVISDFGQGAVLIAKDPDGSKPDALTAGMIDGVENLAAPKNQKDYDDEDMDGAGANIDAAATPFKNLEIVDKPWDSTAAIKRVRQKTGSTEKPSASYKNAFFWYDSADADNFGAYKLPFVDVDGGTLKAVRRGVFAANAAMQGARGGVNIPQKDRAAVQAHIDKYRDKIAEMDKKQARQSSAIKQQTQQEDPKMSELTRLCAENPTLSAEIESIRMEAFTNGAKSIEARVTAVLPYLQSDTYKGPIRELAIKVINGETDVSALSSAVAVYDAIQEQNASASAVVESEAAGDIHAAAGDELSTDGIIRSEADHQAAVNDMRRRLGRDMEV